MNVNDLKAWTGFLQRPFAPREKTQTFQHYQLGRLVSHAAERVPFYRRRFISAGVRSEEIREVADIAALPVVRKTDLVDASTEELLTEGIDQRRCITVMTSGTTGEPVRIVRTRSEQYTLYLHRLRAQVLAGQRPWDYRVKVGSAPEQLWPHRLGVFRCGSVSHRLPPIEILAGLERLRPTILYSAPTHLEVLMAHTDQTRLRLLRPRLVFTGAELLRPRTRALLQETFACPIVDFYGTVEVNLLASECRECGLYHTCDDSVLVEILTEDGRMAGPGEEGRLIVTALRSFAMPLIRYETGDIVRRPAHFPPCRIRFGSIDRILGRLVDALVFPGGQWLSSHLVEEATDDVQGLRRFQCIQTSPTEVLWKLQPGTGFSEESVRQLERSFARMIPPNVRVRVEVVPEIKLDPTGKHAVVQSWCSGRASHASVPPSR